MPELKNCREILLSDASDGKEEAKYIGDFLLKTASQFAQQLVYGLITNKHHFESDMPIEKIKGAISLFYLICDDGNMGKYHGDLIELYIYLSRVQWERGYHDDAFESLNESLKHAKALEALWDEVAFVDDNTLTVNVKRVRKKLEELGIKNAIVTKRGYGYALLTEWGEGHVG